MHPWITVQPFLAFGETRYQANFLLSFFIHSRLIMPAKAFVMAPRHGQTSEQKHRRAWLPTRIIRSLE